jgi:uncharacterized phage protein (TIGR02220 family)
MEITELYDQEVVDLLQKESEIINKNLLLWVKQYKLDSQFNVDWTSLMHFFNSVTGKSTKIFTEKAKKQFRSRLREGYTKKDIRNAIINAYESDWHRDSNYKWLTLEFISRSDKFGMYLDMGRNVKKEGL